jgi:hypothetical protein
MTLLSYVQLYHDHENKYNVGKCNVGKLPGDVSSIHSNCRRNVSRSISITCHGHFRSV